MYMYIYISILCLHICIYIDTLYILFSVYIIFHELLGFWDFEGILDIKAKMQYLVQSMRTRVARKNFSIMVCIDLHWISLP